MIQRVEILRPNVDQNGLVYSDACLQEMARRNKQVFVFNCDITKETKKALDKRTRRQSLGVVVDWFYIDEKLVADIDFFSESLQPTDIGIHTFGISRLGIVISAQPEYLYTKERTSDGRQAR